MMSKPIGTLSIRFFAFLLSGLLLSFSALLSEAALANHLNNASAKTVDIPTVIKPPEEDDFPEIELLGYKISSGGVTVSLRAKNKSPYRATLGHCEVVGYKGDKRTDRTFIDFYNQIGPGFNMVGSADFYISKNGRATWDKSVDTSNIERVEIECYWTVRYKEPSELVDFSFLGYTQELDGNIYANVQAKNNSDIALDSYACAHTGIKSKEVLVSGFETFVKTLGPEQQTEFLVKLFDMIDHDSHAHDIQALNNEDVEKVDQLDEYGLYCSYSGGPDYR